MREAPVCGWSVVGLRLVCGWFAVVLDCLHEVCLEKASWSELERVGAGWRWFVARFVCAKLRFRIMV